MDLLKLGFELKVMPDEDEVWKKYLDSKGFVYHKIPVKKGVKRPKVESFLKKHTRGTYVLRVAGTIIACEDGQYFNIYDYNNNAIYGYYEKVY